MHQGPNGPGHALLTCVMDYLALPDSLKKSIGIVGGDLIKSHMRSMENNFRFESFLKKQGRKVPILKGERIRKLSFFPDKETKVRVIAIGDYFSQTVLKPLHHYLFRVLKKIPQDCTFNQAGFRNNLDSKYFSSIDLSNATDRFPIKIISKLLSHRLPDDYVTAWEDIMVGYPFSFKGEMINYSTGNPMGFYSS